MVEQKIFLLDWEWLGTVFYEVGPEDLPRVAEELQRIGCKKREMNKALRNLERGDKDRGFTYANFFNYQSVIAIGKTSSADEFMNSYDHEKGHLAKFICMAQDIDPYGEEAEYLAGEIGKQTFPVAKRFLCDCCRKKNYARKM